MGTHISDAKKYKSDDAPVVASINSSNLGHAGMRPNDISGSLESIVFVVCSQTPYISRM